MEKNKFKSIPTMLILGAAALILGVAFLAFSLGSLPNIGAFWPVLVFLSGLFCLNWGYFKSDRKEYIFIGFAGCFIGVMALLNNTILPHWNIKNVWPIYMALIGISMVPYALASNESARISILIPSLVIIFFSLLFIPFSFGFVEISFVSFVIKWWPILLIGFGLIIIIAYFVKEHSSYKDDQN